MRQEREEIGRDAPYVAAQAFAAGLLYARCLRDTGDSNDAALQIAAQKLVCQTLYGAFQRDPLSDLQKGHQVLIMHWQQGQRWLVWPLAHAESPSRLVIDSSSRCAIIKARTLHAILSSFLKTLCERVQRRGISMQQTDHATWNTLGTLSRGARPESLLTIPFISEIRLKQSVQALTDAWQHLPIEPRHSTLLGMSFRLPQVAALELDARATLQTLLAYPFQLIRLGAYWNRMEPEPGIFYTDELDWQIDAAEQAGKQIMLCVGPLKTFSYPEFFVPAHHLQHPFPEHTLIKPSVYPSLLAAAIDFATHLVERYKHRQSIVAWQLEHEAVDPLGVEHSWRLDSSFLEKELTALRQADPTRPIMLNGFLPTSLLVRLTQWWRTRDQGDSLAIAQRLADIVGIDYYPRHALMGVGTKTLYLDGSHRLSQQGRRKRLFAWARAHGKKLMVAEGQAEPWETVTAPPNPDGQGMYSCLPEQVIANYNAWMRCSEPETSLYAYLFWGAEYWILRKQCADPSYLQAFARILEHA